MSHNTTMTRRQLYEAIWSTPLQDLAAKHGLRSKVFTRACKRHNIPRPSAGYWSKKRAGWADPPPPLAFTDDSELDTVMLVDGRNDDESKIAHLVRHAVDDEINRQIEEELTAPPVLVPERVQSPHRFVAATMQERTRREAEERHRKKHPQSSGFHEPESQTRANVYAHSKETRDRAYRIMDAFFKALEERGYDVSGKPQRFGGNTFVTVLGMVFDVRLHEPCRRQVQLLTPEELQTKKKYGSVDTRASVMVPTGRLCLEFRNQSGTIVLAHRKDGVHVRLENTLNDLIVSVLRKVDESRQAAKERKRKAAVRREAESRQRQEAERLKEVARLAEQERADIQSLLADVKQWRDSQEIRAYLDEIRRVVSARGEIIQPGSEFATWMDWASGVASELNPLRSLAPPTPTRPAG